MLKEQTQPTNDWQTLTNIGDNLYRSSKSGKYYAIFKRNGKQIRRSLKTTDKQLAQRKLAELRSKIGQLDTGDAAKIAFSILDAKGKVVGGLLLQYIDHKLGNMQAKTKDLNIDDTKTFATAFNGQPVRNINLKDLEAWAAKRKQAIGGATFNRQLGLLKRIFSYAVTHGIRMDNPVERIDRAKPKKVEAVIPTRQEFSELVAEIRKTSIDAAEFVEAMGYSGCRVSEIGGDKKWGYPPLYWNGEETAVNFEAGTFTVVGKGRKTRTVPLFPPLRELLLRRKRRLTEPPKPSDPIFGIEDPRTSIKTACENLGWAPSRFTNHDCRHFFCSNCIESGIDFKVIAAWLGHMDGGILVARTYGHLRQEHSMQMAAKMTFSATPPNITTTSD